MRVQQRPRQHIRTGHSELEGSAGDARCFLAIGVQIQTAFTQRTRYRGCWLAPESHGIVSSKGLIVAPSQVRADAFHGRDEVLDHAVRIRMIDIKAIQFAIGRQVDSGLSLHVENDASRVDQGGFTGQRGEPVGNRIRADSRRKNVGFAHVA